MRQVCYEVHGLVENDIGDGSYNCQVDHVAKISEASCPVYISGTYKDHKNNAYGNNQYISRRCVVLVERCSRRSH